MSKGTRPAKTGRCVLAMDIGGTKTLFGVFDDKLRMQDEIKIKTEPGKGSKAFVERVTTAVEALLESSRKRGQSIVGIGVGVAGEVSFRGDEIVASLNIPFLPRIDLREKLHKLTGQRATFGNDCQLALLAEHHVGAAVGGRMSLAFSWGRAWEAR